MRFTLGWLREHLETDASLDQITEALTNLGLEVEAVEDPGARLAPFTIARVVSAQPHPNADKLRLCMVDTGQGGEPVQVVCGAPNARAGMMAVFAPPGAFIPGTGITLKVAAVRGVESRGMLVSERELELSDAHEGIIELSADAPLGRSYAAWAGLDDPVIEIAVTPNRQDCMGVWGVARDLAAAGLGRLVTSRAEPVPGRFPCPVPIRIEDADGCPAFLGRVVRGVRNGPSPEWLQRRLRAIGQKPISALVDITNWMTIDRGRPLHVYDLAKLEGEVVARRARAGETIEALNGRSYALTPEMTVIADAAMVHDIGGIMGGAHSGVSEATTDILIECAYFSPLRIARTGRALGLASDARARFERGVDPGFMAEGMELATRLVLDLCGGEPSGVVLAGAIPRLERTIRFRPARVAALGGLEAGEDEQAAILTRLGFAVSRGVDAWDVAVPSWRRDVEGEADLVEEVARVAGFSRVPPVALPRADGVARPTATPAQLVERRLRRSAAALGLAEAVTWSFIAPAEAEAFGGAAWTLDNPIASDMAAMRPSLLPGLLSAARRNLDRGRAGVALFEIGRRYLAEAERPTLALLLAGEARSRHWRTGPAAGWDALDAKALVLALVEAAGAPAPQLFTDALPAWLHPGRSARLGLGPKQTLAVLGELHPRLTRDFQRPVVAAELFLDALPAPRGGRTRPAFAPPALQSVTRDFAFLAPEALPAETLLRAVRGADKAAISAVELFDRFAGRGVPEGRVSLAVGVTFQPGERSFTDAELEALSQRVIEAAGKVGATLRG
jgi:phenylalanyl-tRNA synthetase beta chain